MTGLTAEESARGVHATHDMVFHRPIRAGECLTVRGTVVRAEPRSPGAYLVTRFDTADAAGEPVLTVYYGSLFRGVPTTGPPRMIDGPLTLPPRPAHGDPLWQADIVVPRHASHVYTECADIYNPIHTERAVALAAGLPDIIVHGTLTLAYAARELLNREADADPERLTRIACRFSGMVFPGTAIDVRLDGAVDHTVGRLLYFSVVDGEGTLVIRDGTAVVTAAGSLANR
jgi:acyl dehydratase